MPSEPKWLSADEIEGINHRVVRATGEPFLVRDRGLLEGAAARPVNTWAYGEQRMGWLAGRLLLGVAQNHPFEQGNKRAAVVTADVFLFANGFDLRSSDNGLADRVLDVLNRRIGEDEFLAYFGRAVRRLRE